mgnify:CR=1 FL=1
MLIGNLTFNKLNKAMDEAVIQQIPAIVKKLRTTFETVTFDSILLFIINSRLRSFYY